MTTIENARYQGYLWYSDQRQPEVYLGKTSVAELILDESKNPFIIEGKFPIKFNDNLFEERYLVYW